MNNELISIIVPIYKVEKYLERCVNSIINQTYNNTEIILVDDGSPDNCGKICDALKKTDNRIKVIHQKNKGLSGARNTGIEKSNGEYLIFIDSDDYIETTMVEELYKNLIENESDISVCGFRYVYENESKTKNCKYCNDNFVIMGEERFKYIHNNYSMISVIAWNKLYKKDIFANVRYTEGKHHEDELAVLNIFKNANKISYNLKPLYNYVQRNGSITSCFNMKMFDSFEAYIERKNYYEELKNNELLDLNDYFKFCLYYNILKTYSNSTSKELSKDKIEEIINETITLCKKLLSSKYIVLKRKIMMLYFLVIRKKFIK